MLDCIEGEARGLEVAIKRQSIPRRYGAGGSNQKADSLQRKLDMLSVAADKIAKIFPDTP